jgi:hypothetical protein
VILVVWRNDHTMRRAILLLAGILWLLFAVCFGFVLLRYIAEGAGLQFYGWMFSSGSILVGLVHVSGFVFAAFLCFAVGAVLFSCGLVRSGDSDHKPKVKDS